MTMVKLSTSLITADNRMTTLSHYNTDATELAKAFKLSEWIGLINWTRLLQSERYDQYVDIFVCSWVIKVKIISLIYLMFS